jgi:hypothetical protein
VRHWDRRGNGVVMFRLARGTTLTRSRWAGIGAAVAVSLGAGGIGLIAHAANSAPSSFVSITACRLFDTRPGPDNVGNRHTPLNAGEDFVRPVWGTNGNCTIPTTATGISFNLTVSSGINGFLTVYPSDAPRPLASNLNPVAGEGVKANSGIVGLSAAGAITVFTSTGPLDAVLDITGFLLPGDGSPVGPPAGPGNPGPRGFSAWDAIPSGQTTTGSLVYDKHEAPARDPDSVGADLPGIASTPLTALTVNFGAADGALDSDPECTGTLDVPTAPPGKVCIYLGQIGGINLGTLNGRIANLPTRSFIATWNPLGIGNTDEFVFATWAYTAP